MPSERAAAVAAMVTMMMSVLFFIQNVCKTITNINNLIEVGIYDKMNKIICSGSIRKEKSDFMGFEVFSYAPIYLPKPITEIGRIVFYPTKI